ncbi:MAG: hypothetical protein IJE26_01945 [Oscillospiraceae bacterium]|nr:hypothetical protein [Oscillospiraceae bacterium]
MLTTYGENIDREAPRGEYPRPQLKRDSFLSLNGLWEFTGTQQEGIPSRFAAEICVPFPPESQLSGIGRPTPKGYTLWYRRSFVLPADFNRGRVLLHFDAVDQIAAVWFNGEKAAEHAGGYTPFTVDVTALLQEENTVLVRVEDKGDRGRCAFGGQLRTGSWSGIWQSVWLESVPAAYIDSLQIVPRFAERAVELTVFPGGDAANGSPCTALLGGVLYEMNCGLAYTLPLPEDAPVWTPEQPALIPLEVTLGEDRVESYCALREFTAGRSEDGYPCFLLNGEPCFVSGAVYRALWPDGLAAAPSGEAMAADILHAKAMGFNSIRLTDKVEAPLFYHYCDRLGIMVWQGMPTGGKDTPPIFAAKDYQYGFYGRKDPDSRKQHMRELREMVQTLRSSPSVVLWELFDAGRGQFDTDNLQRFVDELDGSRLIDRSSGVDTGFGQVKSLHLFGKKLRFGVDQAGRPTVLSACGGFGEIARGHTVPGKPKATQLFDSPQGLLFAIECFYEDVVEPARAQGLAGCFYSQLTDVGCDVTGLVSYDRKIRKLAPRQVKKIFDLRF